MISYNQSSLSSYSIAGQAIEQFPLGGNMDDQTVESFGEEWTAFHSFDPDEIRTTGDNYFDILPQPLIRSDAVALDVGCGTGRWSYYLSEKVGFIECIDPSIAVSSAAHLLKDKNNIRITNASVDNIPFADESFDLVFSLGVLHHVPDTAAAIEKCVRKLKINGFILLYLYYNLENRGLLFRGLFHLSNSIRWGVSKLPSFLKRKICDVLAIVFYMPFVLLVRVLHLLGVSSKSTDKIPLSWYADKSFHIIRNDSLDRFGTPLEQRFSRVQIASMLADAGCDSIEFAEKAPFWRVVARKK